MEKSEQIMTKNDVNNSNGDALWVASGIFAYLGDEYYDWSMKCLKRAAWRQHPIAKRMYKDMKEHPYKFL